MNLPEQTTQQIKFRLIMEWACIYFIQTIHKNSVISMVTGFFIFPLNSSEIAGMGVFPAGL